MENWGTRCLFHDELPFKGYITKEFRTRGGALKKQDGCTVRKEIIRLGDMYDK